jgi:hypothetical protein
MRLRACLLYHGLPGIPDKQPVADEDELQLPQPIALRPQPSAALSVSGSGCLVGALSRWPSLTFTFLANQLHQMPRFVD